jgi:hypothetical protein
MLLDDTLTHWHTNARLLQTMIGWWLDAPPADGKLALPSTFSESLYDVLMNARNKAWRETLHACQRGIRGGGWGVTFVRRREFAVAAEIKKWPISLLARQRGISSFLLCRRRPSVEPIVAQSDHHCQYYCARWCYFLDKRQAYAAGMNCLS